jgi:preprotein translocase subunit SecB
VTRAGFPPVVLSPVNFEAIYQAQRDPQPAVAPASQIITPTSH